MLTTLVRESLIDQPLALNQLPAAALQELDTVRALVRATSQASGVDILVISRDGRILFPNDAADGLPQTVSSRLARRVTADSPESQIQTLRTLFDVYFFTKTCCLKDCPSTPL